jgi:hypothetical protein
MNAVMFVPDSPARSGALIYRRIASFRNCRNVRLTLLRLRSAGCPMLSRQRCASVEVRTTLCAATPSGV